MLKDIQFELDQNLREIHLPEIHPPEYYQHENSKKHRRKRRAIHAWCMRELRILRHDIRRKYGEMLVNATNYHEIPLLTRFFNEYFRPDCTITKVSPSQTSVGKNIDSIIISRDGVSKLDFSVKDYLKCYEASFRLAPDQIIRLQESQVRIRQGSQGSIVILKCLLKYVKTLVAHPLKENKSDLSHSLSNSVKQNENISSSSDESDSPFPSLSAEPEATLSDKDDFIAADHNEEPQYYVEPAPVQLESLTAVAIALILDENHFVRKAIVEYKLISETPVSIPN